MITELTLAGRVDSLPFQRALSFLEFLHRDPKRKRRYPVEVKAFTPDDWIVHMEKVFKEYEPLRGTGIVFSYFMDKELKLFGNGYHFVKWGSLNFGFEEKRTNEDFDKICMDAYQDLIKDKGIHIYFEIFYGKEYFGKLVVQLFNSDCPTSCENFIRTCTGENSQEYTYEDTKFHRVNKQYIQGGDVVDSSGYHSESVLSRLLGLTTVGSECKDINNHSRMGSVGIIADRNGYGSQFYITLKDGQDWMDRRYQQVGRVIEGRPVLERIREEVVVETNEAEQTLYPLKIATSGIFLETEDQKEMRRKFIEKETYRFKRVQYEDLLREEFKTLSTNGEVSRDELGDILEKMYNKKFSENEVDEVFYQLDLNHDGKIKEDEYVVSMFNLLTVEEMEEEFLRQEHTEIRNEVRVRNTEVIKKELRESFIRMDLNGDGVIEMDELYKAMYFMMKPQRPKQSDVEDLFEQLDLDSNGLISIDEWVEVMFSRYSVEQHLEMFDVQKRYNEESLAKKRMICIEALRNSFREVDVDCSGYIDLDELETAMQYVDEGNRKPSKEEVVKMMKMFDLDNDGQISEEEYIKVMLENHDLEDLLADLRAEKRKNQKEQERAEKLYVIKKVLRKLFDHLDAEKMGILEPKMLQRGLLLWTGVEPSEEELVYLTKSFDTNKNGLIEKIEWINNMTRIFSVEENYVFARITNESGRLQK